MYGVVSKNMLFTKQALYLKQTGMTRKEHVCFSFAIGNQFAKYAFQAYAHAMWPDMYTGNTAPYIWYNATQKIQGQINTKKQELLMRQQIECIQRKCSNNWPY